MSGNKNSGGHNKKTVAQKKLQGSYNSTRDKEQAKTESIVVTTNFTPDVVLEAPVEIKDEFVRSYYKYHTNQLIQLGILAPSDIPELNQLYFTLEQLRAIQKQIQETNLVNDFETYEKLTKLSIRLGTRFSQLCYKYYISPSSRTRLTIEQLTVEKLEQPKNVIAKLIAQNK